MPAARRASPNAGARCSAPGPGYGGAFRRAARHGQEGVSAPRAACSVPSLTSWPGLTRPSTLSTRSVLSHSLYRTRCARPWMAGSSPAMTTYLLYFERAGKLRPELPRRVVEQLIDREARGDEPLLERIVDDELERFAAGLDADRDRIALGVGRPVAEPLALGEQPDDLLQQIGAAAGEFLADHQHVIDRHGIMLACPVARRLPGVRNEGFQARIAGDLAENRGIDLAGQQHRLRALARRRPLDARGIDIFRDMRVLVGDPFDVAGIDAVVMLEDAAQPGARRLAVGAHADPLALEVGRGERAALGIVEDCVVLVAPDHHDRHQHIGLAPLLGLQIGDDGELAEIEARLAHQRLEAFVRHLLRREGEVD